jgi:hypothetical protein
LIRLTERRIRRIFSFCARVRLTLCPTRAEMDYRQKSRRVRSKVKADLEAQLEQLPNLSTAQLRAIWRELFEHPAHAKVRRELLIPIIAYRLQERAFGGLKPQTARYLREIAGGSRSSRPCGVRAGARTGVRRPAIVGRCTSRYGRRRTGRSRRATD